METCNFLIILMKILPIFQSFFEFYRSFRENLGKNLENFRTVLVYVVLAIFLNSKSKINGNLQSLIILMEILPFFKNFRKFYHIFREYFGKNLGKFKTPPIY